jgi:SAM-dependent methyltransferase
VLVDLYGSANPLVTAAQFDLVAPIYPALERLVFGAHLDNARQAFLKYVLEANRILLVGEGNGRFLKSVIARKLVGCIKVVEKSRMMIRLAKNRVGELAELITKEGTWINVDFVPARSLKGRVLMWSQYTFFES